MDNLKEEAENFKTGISKAVSDVSDIILDRFKNPYITAFSISWVACNWKPIAFFILSKGNVEYKIKKISIHHNNIWYYLWWPLILSLIFLFIIPYLNLVNEWFVKRSVKKRADYIKDQIVDKITRDKDIAIADHLKNEAVRILKEGKDQATYIKKLEDQIADSKSELERQRDINLENQNSFSSELKKINDHFSDVIEEHKKNYEKLLFEKANLQNQLTDFNNMNNALVDEVQRLNSEPNGLGVEVDNLNYDLRQTIAKYALFQRNIQNIDRSDKLFVFEDGQKIIETYNDNNEIMHLNANDSAYIEPDEFLKKINKVFFDEYYLGRNKLRLFTFDNLPDELKNVTFQPRDRA
ncbi:coiled-coil domain-containing protein [Chryseobacterium indologenes]|uniref:hypothetical protein n=1 Tax=Chryseobacterium indologenes TaxID=253 RepID=UPI004058AF0E